MIYSSSSSSSLSGSGISTIAKFAQIASISSSVGSAIDSLSVGRGVIFLITGGNLPTHDGKFIPLDQT